VQRLRYVALLALLTVLGGGAAFAAVEKKTSTRDSVWWAVTTMTTVGYGDIAPKTVLGRVIGMVVMLVGIGFIAVLTGAVAQRFLASQVEEVVEREEEIEAARADFLSEVREIQLRLRRLEVQLERRIRAHEPPIHSQNSRIQAILVATAPAMAKVWQKFRAANSRETAKRPRFRGLPSSGGRI
jgi:hypothetical protein